MVLYHNNNFRSGLKIQFEKAPYIIEYSEFVKPGKGQAFSRVKMRCLLTNKIIEKIFKPTDVLESANVVDVTLTYLYHDSNFWYFMNYDTCEQITADSKSVGNNAKWLHDQIECTVTLWNDNPIIIIPPNFIELKVVKTDPGFRGDTASNATKPALLNTGVIVKVPLFIQIGEIIKIDTRSGNYVSRVKSL